MRAFLTNVLFRSNPERHRDKPKKGLKVAEPEIAREGWPLTSRQMECLERFWQRKNAKEIALELGISHETVEIHLKRCRQRLGTATSIDAARMVFGDHEQVTVRPYYDPTGIPAHDDPLQLGPTPTAHTFWGVASEQAPINRFGAVATLAIVLAVAIVSIGAVALLITAGQGIVQLGSAMGF
ncbi:helix-turn-helix domain-containing protein [Sphingomonas sp. BN140010]|uniref:Helix-turn-helix domain-containing protein n=1 Tax=Sphingomonas arvum TaxID=2992113 RepID=A0ABT3JCI9_9SPHN|nr:helix-turn-helix domain-containing protein [Sphingomonas sp. BN140010]MCW3796511.1 helix-turn-helix domain-containing protein [Sphingomonas sp. BN140010]